MGHDLQSTLSAEHTLREAELPRDGLPTVASAASSSTRRPDDHTLSKAAYKKHSAPGAARRALSRLRADAFLHLFARWSPPPPFLLLCKEIRVETLPRATAHEKHDRLSRS